MIYAAPAAADDGIDRAVLTKGLHQLHQRVALHAGEADRYPLDRIGDFVADRERRENRAEEILDETVDIGGGVTHVVKAHGPAPITRSWFFVKCDTPLGRILQRLGYVAGSGREHVHAMEPPFPQLVPPHNLA